MAARSTWSGAITFAGFPIPVRVFTLLNSRKSESFKMLDPVHKMPVSQKLVDIDNNEVSRGETLKGVKGTGDNYYPLPPEGLELIENVGRSDAIAVERFALVDSIPLDLSLERYRIVPDEKVPGSDQPVQILWNGLRESKRAAIIPDWTPRAGARPSTLVIRSTGDGLAGNLLPFGSELKLDLPTWVPEANEKAAQMFAAVVAQQYCTEDFDLSVYLDRFSERRTAAIKLALSGEPIPTSVAAPTPAAAAPDLMALLEASLAGAPAKAPTPTTEKVAA